METSLMNHPPASQADGWADPIAPLRFAQRSIDLALPALTTDPVDIVALALVKASAIQHALASPDAISAASWETFRIQAQLALTLTDFNRVLKARAETLRDLEDECDVLGVDGQLIRSALDIFAARLMQIGGRV